MGDGANRSSRWPHMEGNACRGLWSKIQKWRLSMACCPSGIVRLRSGIREETVAAEAFARTSARTFAKSGAHAFRTR